MLSDKIAEWRGIADKRNLAVENPVTLIVTHNGEQYFVVVAHLEPNRVTLPMNVIWIVADPESPNYNKALRRVSAFPALGYRNTWAQLMTEGDLFSEPQFWDVTSSFQIGEVQVSQVGPATPDVRGLFSLNLQPEPGTEDAPVVIGNNDERMRDARQPEDHDHANQPRTMIHGASGINEYYVRIQGPSPVPGQILIINDFDEELKEATGVWATPTLGLIDYDGPTFDSLEIVASIGGDTVNEGVPVVFQAIAHFSGGIQQGSIPASWSIIAGQDDATINASTGVLTTQDVTGDKLIRVRAEWTHVVSNTTRVATFDLNVVDTTVVANLVSIEIQGLSNINEGGNTTPYVVVATYDDATTRAVVPNTFTSSNPAAGTLNVSTGVFTSASNLASNQTTTLSASYTENGVTRADTHEITVIDTTVYPASASVLGPNTVNENSTATYTLQVLFTNGSTSLVSVTNWSSTVPEAGTIGATSGVFTTPVNLDEDVATVITASFTSNGVTVTGNKPITAVDASIYPTSATVLGADTVNEGANSTYQLRVNFSNGTNEIVPVTDWTSSVPAAGTIGATTGQFSASLVAANTATTLTATFTQSGTTVTGTKSIDVIDTTNYPVSLVILGNSTMNESTTQTLTARVTYLDNSTAIVPVSYTSSNPAAATVGSANGVVTAALNLQAAAQTTITATYTEFGVTRTATFVITVQDVTIYPASAVIQGLTTVNEGISTQYQLRVTFTNGSNQIVSVNNWAIDNPAAGTLTTGGLLTAPANVPEDVTATITASYTLDGVTRSASLNITVTDDTVYPSTATIIGPNSVDENGTQTYTLRVDFSDASNQIVTVSDWASSNTAAGTIESATGVFQAMDLTEDAVTTISASYTAEGETVSDSLVVTVVDTTVYPASAVIVGPNELSEDTSTTYVFRVTFTDESEQDVAISNWASSNGSAGVINASTGVFAAPAAISSDATTTISGSYTADGVTVSTTKNITVKDTTNYPVSATVQGPATINEGSTATYTLNVLFTDGNSSVVGVTDWASSNPAAGTIDPVSGVFTAASNSTGSNITTTITATHTVEGVTRTGTRNIGIVDTTVYPVSATIEGATAANEGASPITYQLRVNFSNGTNSIQPADSWTSSNASAGAIDSGGVFTLAADIIGNQTTTIGASFTQNGQTVTDTHTLIVSDTVLKPVSAVISGPNSAAETLGPVNFTLTVTYDNGTNSLVNANTVWSHTNATAGSINASTGVFTPANITATQTTSINAEYTLNGVTINAPAKSFNVNYVKIPVSAEITGGTTTMAEGSAAQNLQLRVTFDDGINDIYATNNWAISNPLAGAIGASTGVFTPATNVTTDQAANITASYTEAGQTVTGTRAITVTNAINRPVSATILGVTTIGEGNTTTFQFRVTYESGLQEIKAITNWANSVPAAGSIVATTGVFTAASVTANQNTVISGSFTENGFTVNATHNLAVTDTAPVARARWGVAQFADVDFTGGKVNPNMAGTAYEVWSGPQQFITDELTNVQSGPGPFNISVNLQYEPAPHYGYFAHPASMGTATFVDSEFGFPGGWDGASWADGSAGDGPGEVYGPLTVTFNDGSGPELWKVYRTDFNGTGPWSGTVTIA